MAGRFPIAALALMLASGLALGLWSSWRVLASGAGPGSVSYGPWTVWPRAGAADADPYSLATFSRRGDIPMTPGEGLAFFAARDSDGSGLRSGCRYLVAGALPPARAWTLTAYAPDGGLLTGPSGRSGFTAAEALVEDGRIAIAISPEPRPGNWLPLAGDRRFVLALRLYETPVSGAATSMDAMRLPAIERQGCS
jgi:hypothetical protein